ncbi:uncharacterized protein LOC118432889 [Folsomia candida]|uniref:uncharacterized protein LOC118432889 n=1 Tax=Folsomia candida TaxID=158441 RepID=UPI000B8F8088|nr:uncharacterized protein LOC118432889 [Folsomia candida]
MSFSINSFVLFAICSQFFWSCYCQTYLKANGDTDSTYDLIAKVLGGGKEAVETPDCAHPSFPHHISQVQDDDLNRPVFAFYIHVTPDNDRCEKTDRQRTEIKTFGPSPKELKGFEGESVSFSWNFKLDTGFKASTAFTHIHQIKAGDGPNAGSPIITLTPRFVKNSNKQLLQVLHVGDTETTVNRLKEVDLSPFIGEWVHVSELITYGSSGKYQLAIKRLKDGKSLLSVNKDQIDLWRQGTIFVRPKWGIYRSLGDKSRLRDETVLFDNFCLGKGSKKCT